MLIDWFTVIAQIVNFLVLVWLLKRFLYRRILDAIAARESRIAASIAEAAAKEKEAEAQLALYNSKLQEFERQEESMLAEARLEASKQAAGMLEKAREDTRALEARWKEELEREQSALVLEFRSRAASEIFELARRTVADLAGLDVQECAVRVFLEKIRALEDENARKGLAQGELRIRTAFDLCDSIREDIRHALEDRLRAPVMLRFERTPGIGVGIELRGNGWRIGWNSETYLEEIEAEFSEALERTAQAKVHAGGA